MACKDSQYMLFGKKGTFAAFRPPSGTLPEPSKSQQPHGERARRGNNVHSEGPGVNNSYKTLLAQCSLQAIDALLLLLL